MSWSRTVAVAVTSNKVVEEEEAIHILTSISSIRNRWHTHPTILSEPSQMHPEAVRACHHPLCPALAREEWPRFRIRHTKPREALRWQLRSQSILIHSRGRCLCRMHRYRRSHTIILKFPSIK